MHILGNKKEFSRVVSVVVLLLLFDAISLFEFLRRFHGAWGLEHVLGTIFNAAAFILLLVMLKKYRRKAEEFSQYFESVMTSIDEGFIVVDLQHNILQANAAYCKGLKMECANVVGRKCYKVSHGLDVPCSERGEDCPVEKTIRSGKPSVGLHVHHDGEGGERIVQIRSYPLCEDGRMYAVVEVTNDITDRKNLESQLIQSQKMEVVGQLAAGVAHDFNNFLTAIGGFVSIAKLNPREPKKIEAYLDQALSAVDRAAALTARLAIFNRKSRLRLQRLDLNQVVLGASTLVLKIIGEKIRLKNQLDNKELNILGDPGYLDQLIMNLATNARDAMPQGGSIEMRTELHEATEDFIKQRGFGRLRERYAVLTVSDTGSGMDAKTKAHIFEPFFTTKEVGKGTGLGLAMVFETVKKHGGYVEVESSPGLGTRFLLFFPVTRHSAEAEFRRDGYVVHGKNETLLLVDDDLAVRSALSEALRQFGYNVIEAGDGLEAIECLGKHESQIRLVISDVMMPRMDGQELRARLKEARPGVKVLLMSGYDRTSSLSEEDRGVLQKPVKIDELTRAVAKLLAT